MEKLFALIGHPLGHSLSPYMHNGAFKHLDINAFYSRIDICDEEFDQACGAMKTLNYKGFNVTIPYKERIIDHLDYIDPMARVIGAVNTVVNRAGQWHGYNTDCIGFLRTLDEAGINLEGKNVCILGHGGAARAVAYGCLKAGASRMDVFTRDKMRVDDWYWKLAQDYKHVQICLYQDMNDSEAYDLVVNTTPVGMHPDTGLSVVDTCKIGYEKTVFYDLIYNPFVTRFLEGAKESGRQTINGLDMLIYQGIEALDIWIDEIDIIKKWTRQDVLNEIRHLL